MEAGLDGFTLTCPNRSFISAAASWTLLQFCIWRSGPTVIFWKMLSRHSSSLSLYHPCDFQWHTVIKIY